MKKSLALLVAVGGMLMPASALAASYTFSIDTSLKNTATKNDTNGLDHTRAYAWNMSGFSLGVGETVTSAYLTFTNIKNWDLNPNALYVYVASTSLASPTGCSQYVVGGACGTQGSTTVQSGISNRTTYYTDSNGTAMFDEFANFTNPLYTTSTAKTKVGQTSFSGVAYASSVFDFATAYGGSGVLTNLTSYIGAGAGGDFALLLDSDCHYFFDNITLTMNTATAGSVPEPGSIVLFATILAVVGMKLRKKNAATLA